ncbi:MAG: hypothetical protein LC624_02105 [Halobacteriales archaeon]|nr:hypothetical protein [Halobacteriales archaeon]
MRAPLAVPLAGLVLLSALSGCLSGAFHAADFASVPGGWAADTSHSTGGEQGNVLVKVQYAAKAYAHSPAQPLGGAVVVSVSSVPFIDIQGEIKKRIDEYVQGQGIQLTQTATGATHVQGDAVDFILYDAQSEQQGQTIHGRAIDAKWTCGANKEAVRVFAFAATEILGTGPGGLTITRTPDSSTWTSIVGTDPPADPAAAMLASATCA